MAQKEFIYTEGEFKKLNKDGEYVTVSAVQTPVDVLLTAWEEMILELSEKEIRKYELKEDNFNKQQEIIKTTDFNGLYGKNNKDVRKLHVDKIMADDFKEEKDLEFSIGYLEREINFLKELVRAKQ